MFEYIQTATFNNIWYWIITIVSWSITCHWTIGVPYDALVKADEAGGEHAERVDMLARISAARLVEVFRSAGLYITTGVSFLMALVVTLGFWFGMELMQGFALLGVPHTVVLVGSVQLAHKIHIKEIRGASLRRILVRRRLINQIIGLVAICIAAIVAAFHLVERPNWY